jgi:hypothetical protein
MLGTLYYCKRRSITTATLIAVDVLAIPIISSENERVFSAVKLLLSTQRQALH